jgi:hypothetical protein
VILYGIIAVILILTFVSYAIVQETRAQLHWRGLVQDGNVDAIRQLMEDEVQRWHSERVPKDTPALLWHGIQTVELIDVGPRGVHVNCSAEGEYSLVDGRRVETSSPVAEGKKITQKVADLLLYDVPNVRPDFAQIDVYTSFRDEHGLAETRCVLSTVVHRHDVEDLDWEATSPDEFIARTGGRFVLEASGALGAVEPFAWIGERPEDARPEGLIDA